MWVFFENEQENEQEQEQEDNESIVYYSTDL